MDKIKQRQRIKRSTSIRSVTNGPTADTHLPRRESREVQVSSSMGQSTARLFLTSRKCDRKADENYNTTSRVLPSTPRKPQIHTELRHHEYSQASLERCRSPTFCQSLPALCRTARFGPVGASPALCSPAGTPRASPSICAETGTMKPTSMCVLTTQVCCQKLSEN